jgi:hypothetical protein
MLLTYAKVVLDPSQASITPVEHYATLFASPRFKTFAHQLAAEAWGLAKEPERALEQVRSAADQALTDVTWLERCPALAGVRRLDGHAPVLLAIRDRVQAIWAI